MMKKIVLFVLPLLAVGSVLAQSQNALDFDGIDDEIQVPAASSLIANANGMTITCWVYPTNAAPMYPDFDGFAGFRNEFDCDFYVMQVSPASAIEARLRNSNGVDFTITNQGLTLNTWQHLALTYDGAMLRLFIGGVLADSVPANGTITNTSEPFHIGTLPYGINPYWLTGKLDEISLFDRALTPAEISCIAQESVNADDPGCKLFYTCNQGVAGGDNTAIASLEDESGHIDGDFYNMTLNGANSNFVGGIANAATLSANICHGDIYQFGNEILTETGYYYETTPQNGGCGTLQELNLFVLTLDTTVTQVDETLISNENNAGYQWVDCDNGYAMLPGETNQSFTPVVDGNYAVVVTLGTCPDTSACFQVLNVGLGNANQAAAFRLFPNPVKDQLTITGTGAHPLTITDAVGRTVYESEDQLVFPASIGAGLWPRGVYLVTIKTGSRESHFRIIKN